MKNYLLLFNILVSAASFAQGTIGWNQPTRGVSIDLDASNNSIVADYDYNPAGDISVTKRDASGNLLWTSSFDQTDNTKWERASWVVFDHSGNIIVTGTLMSGYSNPVVAASIIMKYNSAGTLLWRHIFDGPFDGSSTHRCLIDNNDNIYVLGIGNGPNGLRTRVKKFTPSGTVAWDYFDAAGIGSPVNFKLTPDNYILITARSVTGILNGYSRIDLSGNLVWTKAGISSLTVGDIAGDSYGNSYIIHAAQAPNNGTTVRKIKPNGTEIWQHSFALTAFRIEVGTDNLPIICGFPSSGTGGAAFAKVNSNGNQIWLNTDADGPQVLLLHAYLQLDSYNNAYLAAGQLGSMGICKINSNGTNGWTTMISGSGAACLKIGSDYNVYAVGGSTVRLNQAIPCVAPSNRFASNITGTSVKLNWDAVPGATSYQIWTRKSTSTTWRKRTVSATQTYVTFTALDCGSDHVWKIRTICSNTPLSQSSWSPIETYITAACLNEITENKSMIEKENSIPKFQISPNPATNYLNLKILHSGYYNIIISDITGREVYKSGVSALGNEIKILDINSLEKGIYVIKIMSAHESVSFKFMKK